MAVVADLDVTRYMGRWYEIARFPNSFERGCTGVTADYALRDDDRIDVVNTCRQDALDGPVRQVSGVAQVEGPGRLSVSFAPFIPFARGDYWVLHLEPEYSLAVVGEPRGRAGWVLARNPQVDPVAYGRALRALRRNGYDTDRLELVEQGAE